MSMECNDSSENAASSVPLILPTLKAETASACMVASERESLELCEECGSPLVDGRCGTCGTGYSDGTSPIGAAPLERRRTFTGSREECGRQGARVLRPFHAAGRGDGSPSEGDRASSREVRGPIRGESHRGEERRTPRSRHHGRIRPDQSRHRVRRPRVPQARQEHGRRQFTHRRSAPWD